MYLYGLLARSTILALVLIFAGAWFMMFASKMMRSKDLIDYRKALRANAFSISIFWMIWVCHAIWPGMPLFNRQIGAIIAESIALLLVFRLVKDVPLMKKVVIWYVWSSLQISIIIIAVRWGLLF
ncbi:MAG: hypothetical protein HY587_02935 [Candidatus Omnitrophica bacterium]|nr:hypothetical protein [Candidatus Omnitrophota bacterium]